MGERSVAAAGLVDADPAHEGGIALLHLLGRVDTKDAKVFGDAAEKVERQYPALVGGIGIYKACCGHGPFTHIDTRGYRARWYGEGAG